jgi:hypothetical protein
MQEVCGPGSCQRQPLPGALQHHLNILLLLLLLLPLLWVLLEAVARGDAPWVPCCSLLAPTLLQLLDWLPEGTVGGCLVLS